MAAFSDEAEAWHASPVSTGPLFGITGATGGIGGRVARALAEHGLRQRLVVRDADRAPTLPDAELAVSEGYHDRAAMTQALRGVDTLLLVSARESAHRTAEHLSAVDAAVDAGVRRVVYTSFLGARSGATFTFVRDHYATEERIRGTDLEFTFLRDSMYLDYMGLVASAEGGIAAPAGNGRFAPVSRYDVAAVAVAALTDDKHSGQTYDVTGPELYTFHDVAAELTRFAGRRVTYKNETLEEAYQSRASYGAPKFEVDGWVTSYVAIAHGELEVVAETVQQLVRRRPQTLREFLAANPDAYAHLLR